MSYIPPHKRHPTTGSSQPTPVRPPRTIVQHRNNAINNNNANTKKKKKNSKATSIVFAKDCLTKWFIVGLPDNEKDSTNLSTFTTFESVTTDSLDKKFLALLLKDNCEEDHNFSANPWEFIAKTVKEDFDASVEKVKNMIKENHQAGALKPYLVVRFGKVLFDENFSSDLEYTRNALERQRRSFHVNVPPSYMQHIDVVVPKIGLDFLEEKDSYHLILSDNTQPGATISCKCKVIETKKRLQLHKIELTPVRHFVADMTCLDKNLDLRLMFLTKRKSCFVKDEELENIKSLIGCAILDQEIKGGLKWPLGKSSFGRHDVFAVWHTNSRLFKNSSMKLKVRVADRYNFRTSEGEVAREVSLKLNNVVSLLGNSIAYPSYEGCYWKPIQRKTLPLEEKLDSKVTYEVLKENFESIWKHFVF